MTSPNGTRPRAVWDIVLSIVLLVMALGTGVIGLFADVFIIAFTDYCPPATCHVDQGVAEVFATWGVVAFILIAAIVLSIVLLVKRRRAWWVALIALLVVILGGVLASLLYAAAVG